jgi:small-conductance mechanosensitive channel
MLFQEPLTGAAQWAVPLLLFGAVFALGLALRTALMRALTNWSKKTATRIDDYVVAAIRQPSYLWIFILALIAGMQAVDLPGEQLDGLARRILAALLILSMTIGASRLLATMVQQAPGEVASDAVIASTGLLRTVVRVGVSLVGILLILGTLGINISPLLGALGVGGLAAGLALQPTLTNLFAGFQVAVTRQIRIGNRVRLASGEEGWVTDISWRSTTLRTPANHLILVPNSKFADSILTNYSLPDPLSNVVMAVNVAYDSDARRVHAVLLDEAKRMTAELPQLVHESEPVVRLASVHGFVAAVQRRAARSRLRFAVRHLGRSAPAGL